MIAESIYKKALFMQYVKPQRINYNGDNIIIGKTEEKIGIKINDIKIYIMPFYNNENIFVVKVDENIFEININKECHNNTDFRKVADDFNKILIFKIIDLVLENLS